MLTERWEKMIDIRGNEMDKTINRLSSIAESLDLTWQDKEAIDIAKETIRERNKTVYLVTILEALSKEGYCSQIFGYSIWKLVCGFINSYPDMKQRKQACIDECKREIEKWTVE